MLKQGLTFHERIVGLGAKTYSYLKDTSDEYEEAKGKKNFHKKT